MRKIVFILFLLIAGPLIYAQELPHAFKTYLEGCQLMTKAIETRDFATLTDAKLQFSHLRLTAFPIDILRPADEESQSHILPAKIYYTIAYANDLIANKVFEIDDIKYAHMMRDEGDGEYDLQIWNASIEPRSKVTFTSLALDDCEMMLYTPESDQLRLEVWDNSGKKVESVSFDSGRVWFAGWMMPDTPESYRFSISNEGNKTATFVIAIN